ncbi:uncharacterized protein LOC111385687 [Olea europaea var. sylvestris]|uniref:uncharacterized protein LOC111385687 n=1 Tax=Olea europaea var. sylvestris TaxID=158386 RepID=UPI000C1D3990|nr:uncharacterized protein LOC111385687 [Olea europaea var. sylvestris]
MEELTQNLQKIMQKQMELQEGDMSKAPVALTPAAASIPMPKLKNVNRLKTEHQVYELPDSHEFDIEDNFEDHDDIPTIQLNMEELTQNLREIMQKQMELEEGDMSKAPVALTPEAASIPMPKLKNVNRLRTEHQVYELPDSHEFDIEDNFEDHDDIPTIQLNMEELTQNLREIMQKQMELEEGDMSKAPVALTPEAASIPMPKLKNVNRLRTEHQVYELPDSHEFDIEDNFEDHDDIPTIQLNMEELTQNLREIMQKQMELEEGDMSKAPVALTPEAASIPMPKLKNVNRLRTEHQVYELPDSHEFDIEDNFEDHDDIPTIQLNMEEFTQNLQKIMQRRMELPEGDMSKASVALTPEAASIPMPKLKNVNRLRTEHQVYELPDSHEFDIEDNFEDHDDIPTIQLNMEEFTQNLQKIMQRRMELPEGDMSKASVALTPEAASIPMPKLKNVNRLRTEHQVYELPDSHEFDIEDNFEDHIQYCFWRGFVCVRGFDRKTRALRPLIARLHFPASKLKKKCSTPQGICSATVIFELAKLKKFMYKQYVTGRMNLGKGGLFFIDGPRGTGKIILDHALLAMTNEWKIFNISCIRIDLICQTNEVLMTIPTVERTHKERIRKFVPYEAYCSGNREREEFAVN